MKTKCLLAILLLTCLAGLLPSALAAARCASGEEIVALLAQAREEGRARVEFRCAGALFDEVRANDFALIEVIKLKAGILNAEVRYSGDGTFEFSGIEYGDTPWSECADEAAVREAILAHGARGETDFALLTTPETCAALYENDHLYAYTAQGGMADARLRFLSGAGIVRVSEAVYTDRLYAVVADEQEFATAVGAFAANDVREFLILFDLDFYRALSEDSERKRLMQASSQLESYFSSENALTRSIAYSEVTYTDSPRLLCTGEADVVEAIRAMGTAEMTAFDLVLDKALYARLSAGDFQRLHELETEAGMSWSRMAYSATACVLFYSEARVTADAVRLSEVSEAVAYVNARAAAGEKEIDLFCTEQLYDRLMGGISPYERKAERMERINDLAAQAGLFDVAMYYSATTHIITLRVNACYPGAEIVYALRRGDVSALTERELETWRAAVALAEAAAQDSPSPRETARRIHDALCERIVYVDDETEDEDDTAAGALLNGAANCDGYADAFYLVGTLAGLNVRCQHGDSYDIDAGETDSVTHMWNLIELDGSWRMIDVTWDDNAEGWEYTWFDLGYDRASRMHIWNEDVSVPLRPATDLSCRPDNEFAAADLDGALAAVDSAASARMGSFFIVFDREIPADTFRAVVDAVSRRVSRAFTYSWNERMRVLTIEGAAY